MLVPPADWATRTSEPPSGADPDHPPYGGGAAAVRGGLASGAGLEPAKAGVRALLRTPTPLPELRAGGEIRTLKQPGLGRLGIPRFPSRPHGAPPGVRTLYSWIKSPVLHPYSSRRTERHAGVEPAFPGVESRHTTVVLMPHSWSLTKGRISMNH
jgi:hypothetical protein